MFFVFYFLLLTIFTQVRCEMVLFLGETGIGKSTMMDTLFNTNFDSTPSSHDLPGVKLKAHTYGTVPVSAPQYRSLLGNQVLWRTTKLIVILMITSTSPVVVLWVKLKVKHIKVYVGMINL